MLPLVTIRWVLLRALQSPMALLVALLALLVVPAMVHLGPWTAGHAHDHGTGIAGAWLTPAGILGCAYGLAVLGQGEVFLRRFGARDRFGARICGLGAPALALQGLVLAGSWILSGVSSWALVTQSILVTLHLVLLALLTWLLGLSGNGRLALFLGIAWLLPGLLADGGLLGSAVAPLHGPLLAGTARRPFADGGGSAFLWLTGQLLLYAGARLLLVPGKTSRA